MRLTEVSVSMGEGHLDDSMDLPSVALYLGAKAETVAQLARKGELPGAQIGKGWIFLREDVLRFLREHITQETEERRAAQLKAQCEPDYDNHADVKAVVIARVRNRRRALPPLPELVGTWSPELGCKITPAEACIALEHPRITMPSYTCD